jgi:hypothetical protein
MVKIFIKLKRANQKVGSAPIQKNDVSNILGPDIYVNSG